MGLVIRMLISAAGLWLAARWIDGIQIESTRTLIFAAVLLGVVNAFIRPLVVVLTLPITLVTLGLFLWVVNAAMLGLVAALLSGFAIDGLPSALLGALIVSVTSWVASSFVGPDGRYEVLVVQRRHLKG